MYLLKNVIKAVGFITVLSSASALAGDFVPHTTINDAKNDHEGGYEFDIGSMEVTWNEQDQITVSVNTNFLNWNNQIDSGGSTQTDKGKPTDNIVFGDLFLSTYDKDGIESQFAFALGGKIRNKQYLDPVNQNGTLTSNKTGLYSSMGGSSAKNFHGQNANVSAQSTHVIAKRGQMLTSGDFHYSTQYANSGYDQLTFDFNVQGISAFQSATQLSLRWAMTCANDIVEGLVKVAPHKDGTPGTSVPEPQTLLLMLMAMAGLAYRRKMNN